MKKLISIEKISFLMLMIIDVFFLTCISGCSEEQQSKKPVFSAGIYENKHINLQRDAITIIQNNDTSYQGIGQARDSAHLMQPQTYPVQQQAIYDTQIHSMSIYELLNQYPLAKTTRHE